MASDPEDILRDPRCPALDRLARLAARALRVPSARFSVLDADRQRVAGAFGLAGTASTRQSPFCRHVVASGRSLALADVRRSDLARGDGAGPEPGLVAYLGIPVRSPEGAVLGTLAALAPEPRDWAEEDVETLGDVAAAIATELGQGRASAAIPEAEGSFRAVFEAVHDALLLVAEGGQLVDANPAACTRLGLTRDCLIGRQADEFTPPGSAFAEGLIASRSAGQMGGASRVVRLGGTSLESERHHRWLIENTTEVTWRVGLDAPCPTTLPEDEQVDWFYRHGHVADCNRAMARLYGFEDPARLVGQRLGQVFDRSDPANESFMRAFIRAGYRLDDVERAGYDPSGRRRFSLNNLVAMVEGGVVHSVWGTSRDITARKQAEEALGLARDAAEAANRAKDDFLAIISHELRTPLAPTLLAATVLLVSPLSPDARRRVEAIRRNVELEARLVEDLLDGARMMHGGLSMDFGVVDVHEEISQAVEICRGDADAAGLAVELDLSAPAHHTRGDGMRIKQICWNLIRNAAKFTPAGGRLTIRSANPAVAGAGGRLVVEFRDCGIGIAPEALARIFDPFAQGDAAPRGPRGGLGLGLAIGRGLAEAHGGRLTAESPGKGLGTTFRLELETLPGPAPGPGLPAEVPAPGLPAPGGNRLSILIVEDNADTLEFLGLILGLRGHDVTSAATMAAALAAFRPDFDLILSDIELPDGSGHDLIRVLNACCPTPAIALSGFGSEEDVRQSLDAGFAEHLTKPVEVPRLEAAIRRVARGGK